MAEDSKHADTTYKVDLLMENTRTGKKRHEDVALEVLVSPSTGALTVRFSDVDAFYDKYQVEVPPEVMKKVYEIQQVFHGKK